ncbi:MAG: hypothetical protein JWL77_6215 [Chthonomonadaceae bacterium]|nr:hypothetical protein [Chthonomonadaceae bacterium]
MNAIRDSRWAWAAAAVAVCLGLALFGLRHKVLRSVPLYYQAAGTLPDEIKAAKQEGLPMTPADLVRPIAVPDARNGALLYAQIAAVNVYPKADAYLVAVIKGKATDTDREATRRFLAKATPRLHLAAQASMLPDCDFHRNWSLGPSLLLPEYAPMRATARLLAAQAMLQSEAGHPEAALDTIRVGAHMARMVGKEPTVISLLVGIALEAIMDRVFQRVIERYADRPDILRLAAQTEQEFGPTPDVRNALRGEVVMCRTMAGMVRKDEDLSFINVNLRVPITGAPNTVVADAYEARSLAFWRRVFAAVSRTPDDPMATYIAFKAVNDVEEVMETGSDGKPKPTYELSALLCPYFSGAAEKVVRNEAQRRLRRTLFALLAYRQREGHFPPTLSLLSPTAPSDPYIHQPLHYRRTEKGFLLYSVGSNLIDDGGNAKPAKKGELPPDIVTVFPL